MTAPGSPIPESSPADPPPEATPSDVRIFTWTLAVVGAIALLAVTASIAWKQRHASAERQPTRTRQLVPFQLTERSGRTVDRRELEGQVLVVSFVFTGCAQACLEVSRSLTEVQRLVADRPDVRLVSLTVDPRTDTPAVLSTFAKRFDADPDRWLFLTGDKDAVYRVIEQSFLRRTPADAAGGLPDPGTAGPMPSDFEHAERVALVDRQGRVRWYFDGMRQNVADDIVEAVRELVAEERP